MLTPAYREALAFAATLHHDHWRKGTEIHYLSHLLSVSALVMEHGGDEPEAIAGLLHDAIEDRGHGYRSRFHGEPAEGRDALKRDIGLLFGPRVLGIVVACTDDEQHDKSDRSVEAYVRRKQAYIDHLRATTDAGVLRVSNADKLHNARAILADLREIGDGLWQRFTVKEKAIHVWYYEGLAAAFTERADTLGNRANARLAAELTRVVAKIAEAPPQR